MAEEEKAKDVIEDEVKQEPEVETQVTEEVKATTDSKDEEEVVLLDKAIYDEEKTDAIM